MIIKRKPKEKIESLCRRFKNAVWDSGNIIELRKRKYYAKPSTIKNIKNQKIKRLKLINKKVKEKDIAQKKRNKRTGQYGPQKKKRSVRKKSW